MDRFGRTIIGTVILIGLVRLLSNVIKGVYVLDVVASIMISLGIALWLVYFLKNQAR